MDSRQNENEVHRQIDVEFQSAIATLRQQMDKNNKTNALIWFLFPTVAGVVINLLGGDEYFCLGIWATLTIALKPQDEGYSTLFMVETLEALRKEVRFFNVQQMNRHE
jgi:hypothetical protein